MSIHTHFTRIAAGKSFLISPFAFALTQFHSRTGNGAMRASQLSGAKACSTDTRHASETRVCVSVSCVARKLESLSLKAQLF